MIQHKTFDYFKSLVAGSYPIAYLAAGKGCKGEIAPKKWAAHAIQYTYIIDCAAPASGRPWHVHAGVEHITDAYISDK